MEAIHKVCMYCNLEKFIGSQRLFLSSPGSFSTFLDEFVAIEPVPETLNSTLYTVNASKIPGWKLQIHLTPKLQFRILHYI